MPSGEPRKDLTSSLLSLFKRLIADGSLSPGDRLPPERELAEMVGVSRSSLRQALKILENMGVLSQRVGSGTRLNPAASSILTEPLQFFILLDGITVHELMEARLIVEPELAARAAARATEEDLVALKSAIRTMRRSVADAEKFVASDHEFHQAIFKAAGNRMCTLLFTVVHQSFEELIRFTSVLVQPEHTLRMHRRILAAIAKKDPEGARLEMREHLEDVRELLTHQIDEQARNALEDRLKALGSDLGWRAD
jgi:GntR family transcriptional repressor for pyruvate dehydrogenase complex